MPIPIAPLLGGYVVSKTAEKAADMALSALGGSKGQAPGNDQGNGQQGNQKDERGLLERLLGIPAFDGESVKRAAIQGAVVTALVLMFLVGLYMFVGKSIKV